MERDSVKRLYTTGSFAFGIFFRKLTYFIFYMVAATMLMHISQMLMLEKSVSHHILYQWHYRLAKGKQVDEHEVICNRTFQER